MYFSSWALCYYKQDNGCDRANAKSLFGYSLNIIFGEYYVSPIENSSKDV